MNLYNYSRQLSSGEHLKSRTAGQVFLFLVFLRFGAAVVALVCRFGYFGMSAVGFTWKIAASSSSSEVLILFLKLGMLQCYKQSRQLPTICQH